MKQMTIDGVIPNHPVNFLSDNRIPSTNLVLLDDPQALIFAACKKIRNIVKMKPARLAGRST